MSSAIRPVPHGGGLLILEPPAECSLESEEEESDDDQDKSPEPCAPTSRDPDCVLDIPSAQPR